MKLSALETPFECLVIVSAIKSCQCETIQNTAEDKLVVRPVSVVERRFSEFSARCIPTLTSAKNGSRREKRRLKARREHDRARECFFQRRKVRRGEEERDEQVDQIGPIFTVSQKRRCKSSA
jgi:hypothetical protein